MKTIGKLQINPEKIIKSEELVILRGGYEGPCTCACLDWWTIYGYLLCENGDCNSCCSYVWPSSFGGCVSGI